MDPLERLQRVGLFADLSAADLRRICTDVEELRLEPGAVLFEEGEPGDRAYVVTAGSVEVVKAAAGRETLVAVREPGSVIGEMALLQEAPRSATVRARAPTELLGISKATLDRLLATSPSASRRMFRVLLQRIEETAQRLRQSERMAQLGTLTAGVAHELNNPAAAVRRSAQRLAEELGGWLELAVEAPTAESGRARERVLELLVEHDAAQSPDALARADAEAAVEDWLAARGVAEPWRLAPQLVAAGIDGAALERVADIGGPALADAIRFLLTTAGIRDLVAEVAEGARRLSDIVRVLKGYSYLDQAPMQDVDVRRGLDDTLVLLAHKTGHVRVQREYEPGLPTISAFGSELNQVWMNLIDNACDALAEGTGCAATLTLRAYTAGADVVVEVEDNGPGIPPDVQPRIFDPFFTTKEPGRGTGLGLQLSYQVVVLDHRGELTVDTEPGRTTFRVRLPRTRDDPGVPARSATPPPDKEQPMTTAPCEHLASVDNSPKPEGGCAACLEVGDTWVHLRFCTTCGTIGCCDDSKNRHARRHAEATGHPVFRTKEPGENWAWCVPDDVGLNLPPQSP